MSNPSTGGGLPRKIKGVTIASLFIGAIALPLFVSAPRAHEQNQEREHSEDLLGSWTVQVALDPRTVPPGTPLNFLALYTFSAGGGYVQSNTGPGAGGPPGQGNWMRIGEHKIAATELRFGFDAAHHFTGINKIRESFTLSEQGDELTGNVQVDVFGPDGTLLLFHPVGTYHGTRVEIEPLK